MTSDRATSSAHLAAKECTMTIAKHTRNKPGQNAILTAAELAALGNGEVAYVKAMRSEDVARVFPQAPEIQPGRQLFALLSADGSPILLADNRDTAAANAWAHDLKTVSLH
jgi:hypothetical protein